jgi:hypothetical protein
MVKRRHSRNPDPRQRARGRASVRRAATVRAHPQLAVGPIIAVRFASEAYDDGAPAAARQQLRKVVGVGRDDEEAQTYPCHARVSKSVSLI